MNTAQKQAAALMIVAVMATTLGDLAADQSRPRVLAGGVIAGAVMVGLAGAAPRLGVGLAAVTAITATMTLGPETIRRILN